MTTVGGYFPILERLPGGRLAAVVREGDYHVGQRGEWALVVSDDGGESWSEPFSIAGGPRDPAHPAFGCTRAETLLVSYTMPYAYVDGFWDRSVIPEEPVYITRSDDGGESWTEPTPIDTTSIPGR